MAILSRKELTYRIIIGEKEINGEDEELKGYFQARDEKDEEKAEEHAAKYFKNLKISRENLQKRKEAISEQAKSFLSKDYKIIKELHRKNQLPIFFHDFDWTNLREANYDLRLGEDVYVTTKKLPEKLTQMGADGTISIEPGEFGVLMAHEYVFVPQDLMGFISIRLRHKTRGLVNISGFHVNPGFCGKIMFAVYNAGPSDVVLRYKEPVFMIMFDKLSSPLRKIKESVFREMENIPVDIISSIRGTSVSVRNLDERVKRLELILPVLISIVIGLIGIVLWALKP